SNIAQYSHEYLLNRSRYQSAFVGTSVGTSLTLKKQTLNYHIDTKHIRVQLGPPNITSASFAETSKPRIFGALSLHRCTLRTRAPYTLLYFLAMADRKSTRLNSSHVSI